MGQSMSCGARPEHEIFASVQRGDIVTVRRAITADPSVLQQTTAYDRHSLLHVAAASGHIEVCFSFVIPSGTIFKSRYVESPQAGCRVAVVGTGAGAGSAAVGAFAVGAAAEVD
ncbi:hypothetical protein F2Q70_00016378 [Brassica cretica]|uniref:Uncharacterized protein n=1 Tax=Brassica cretica TaxID=69181 RepID=A0A8S9HXA5_BRACR|nr:hypothetical protein F2Q70_00016378 [Brassica cretica]